MRSRAFSVDAIRFVPNRAALTKAGSVRHCDAATQTDAQPAGAQPAETDAQRAEAEARDAGVLAAIESRCKSALVKVEARFWSMLLAAAPLGCHCVVVC